MQFLCGPANKAFAANAVTAVRNYRKSAEVPNIALGIRRLLGMRNRVLTLRPFSQPITCVISRTAVTMAQLRTSHA